MLTRRRVKPDLGASNKGATTYLAVRLIGLRQITSHLSWKGVVSYGVYPYLLCRSLRGSAACR